MFLSQTDRATLYRLLYSVQSGVQCTLYSVVYSVQCSVQCTVYNVPRL